MVVRRLDRIHARCNELNPIIANHSITVELVMCTRGRLIGFVEFSLQTNSSDNEGKKDWSTAVLSPTWSRVSGDWTCHIWGAVGMARRGRHRQRQRRVVVVHLTGVQPPKKAGQSKWSTKLITAVFSYFQS